MPKGTKLPDDDGSLAREVPIHAKLFEVDPVISSEMV